MPGLSAFLNLMNWLLASVGYLESLLVQPLSGCSVGCLACWLAGFLVGYLVGSLLGFLPVGLIGYLVAVALSRTEGLVLLMRHHLRRRRRVTGSDLAVLRLEFGSFEHFEHCAFDFLTLFEGHSDPAGVYFVVAVAESDDDAIFVSPWTVAPAVIE